MGLPPEQGDKGDSATQSGSYAAIWMKHDETNSFYRDTTLLPCLVAGCDFAQLGPTRRSAAGASVSTRLNGSSPVWQSRCLGDGNLKQLGDLGSWSRDP